MQGAQIPLCGPEVWFERAMACPRPESDRLWAFYDHRLGCIVQDARLMFVPVDDHLVHRGDGIFESLRFGGGKVIALGAHCDRLEESAAALSLVLPCTRERLEEVILAVARASGHQEGALRVLVGRGPGGFDIDPAECETASLYVIAHKDHAFEEALFAKGLKAGRSAIPVKAPVLARVKSTNYLPNVLMILEARKRGLDITFSYDDEGFLAEAAVANVALVDGQGVLVVPEFRNALAGTTLKKAATLAQAFMPVAWRGVREEELFAAQELLVLGTGYECMAAVSYEGQPIGLGIPGPVALRLRGLLRKKLEQEGVAF